MNSTVSMVPLVLLACHRHLYRRGGSQHGAVPSDAVTPLAASRVSIAQRILETQSVVLACAALCRTVIVGTCDRGQATKVIIAIDRFIGVDVFDK